MGARSALLGSGAAAVRTSTYKDPRVLAAAKVGPGTTRHFPVTEWTINNAMGSEPKLPAWVEIANHIIPGELGKLLVRLAQFRLDRSSPREEGPSRGRWHDALRRPLDETNPQLVLEASHALRHRGLRHAASAGRGADATCLDDRDEVANLAQAHRDDTLSAITVDP